MKHLVIDASVFVAACQTGEPDHASCVQFLTRIQQIDGTRVSCPTLVLPESAGAVARTTGEPEFADEVLSIIADCPGFRLIDLDQQLAQEGADLAVSCRLRGSDATYVAVARRVQGQLITLDRELLTRAASVIPVSSPMQWIAGTRLPG